MSKIVVIDDDKDFADLIKSFLISHGFEVCVCNDPWDGIRMCRKENPDLILLDIIMPEMDGAEVVRELRKENREAYSPVIFLTGLVSSGEDSTKEGIAVEGETFPAIAKPFEAEELLSLVRKEMGV